MEPHAVNCVTYGAINACSDGFPIENHFAASSLFSVCSTASYSFIPRRLLELIYYCLLSKPYSDNLLYHHQTFKDLKFVWQQPLLQQRPLVSSKVRQQTIKGFTQTAFPTTRRCNPHRPNHLPSPS